MNPSKYVLLTAARDEEDYIENCLRSVLNQTALPIEWLIIDDASRDETFNIVKSFTRKAPFINLISTQNTSVRNFGAKALAINFAYKNLKSKDHEMIGVLDADVSFDSEYYENILLKFNEDPRLGIGGGRQIDCYKGNLIHRNYAYKWSVSGAIQLFKRECFEKINGYLPLPYGGIDAVAEVMARMNGWKVKTFPEFQFYHHGASGNDIRSSLLMNYRIGIREYAYGTHPIFEIGKTVARIKNRPILIGTLSRLFGYLYARFSRIQIDVPSDVLKYTREEQMKRLLKFNRSQ